MRPSPVPTFLFLLLLATIVHAACECGYRILQTSSTFTHRQYINFNRQSSLPPSRWSVQTWRVPANSSLGTVARQNDPANVWVSGGLLHLQQRGWNGSGDVSVAEVHSTRDDVLHGSFRARYSVRVEPDATGGAVAGFFFYHSDAVESDIEIITKDGGSANSIHYTNHPAYDPATDTPIADSAFCAPLRVPWTQPQEHRFEWTAEATTFFQDGVEQRRIRKNVPSRPGKIMLNLWANNGSWSGTPSTRDVHMEIQYVNLYFNTSASDAGLDREFLARCRKAAVKVCVVDDADGDVDEELADVRSGGTVVQWRWREWAWVLVVVVVMAVI